MIEKQKLYTVIQGKKYVQVDNNLTQSIPPGSMRYMDQLDDIVEVKKDRILFLASMVPDVKKNVLVNMKGEDIHMMNKMADLIGERLITNSALTVEQARRQQQLMAATRFLISAK